MGMTRFEELFTSFLYKIRDYEIPKLDESALEAKMTEMIRNAIGRLAQECNS